MHLASLELVARCTCVVHELSVRPLHTLQGCPNPARSQCCHQKGWAVSLSSQRHCPLESSTRHDGRVIPHPLLVQGYQEGLFAQLAAATRYETLARLRIVFAAGDLKVRRLDPFSLRLPPALGSAPPPRTPSGVVSAGGLYRSPMAALNWAFVASAMTQQTRDGVRSSRSGYTAVITKDELLSAPKQQLLAGFAFRTLLVCLYDCMIVGMTNLVVR